MFRGVPWRFVVEVGQSYLARTASSTVEISHKDKRFGQRQVSSARMNTPPSNFRNALPRVGLSETSDLPIATLAARLAAAGERCAALEAYREVLEDAPNDRNALVAMSVILARLGREEEELAVHQRIAVLAVAEMGLAAEDQGAAVVFELATIGMGEVPAQMPRGYTTALFDSYAPHFDKNLRDDLGYRAPEQLHACLSRALGTPIPGSLDTFDLGCGTGLLGPLLRYGARRLDGVDCSPRMLDHARALGVYDELLEDDLTEALIQRPNQYDVVTAADVFVYIGDIAPVLIAVASSLRPCGLVAFTVEVSGDDFGDDYQLTSSGRYEHAPVFVRKAAAAAGLTEVSSEAVILRKEHSSQIEGLVWVFGKERLQ